MKRRIRLINFLLVLIAFVISALFIVRSIFGSTQVKFSDMTLDASLNSIFVLLGILIISCILSTTICFTRNYESTQKKEIINNVVMLLSLVLVVKMAFNGGISLDEMHTFAQYMEITKTYVWGLSILLIISIYLNKKICFENYR